MSPSPVYLCFFPHASPPAPVLFSVSPSPPCSLPHGQVQPIWSMITAPRRAGRMRSPGELPAALRTFPSSSSKLQVPEAAPTLDGAPWRRYGPHPRLPLAGTLWGRKGGSVPLPKRMGSPSKQGHCSNRKTPAPSLRTRRAASFPTISATSLEAPWCRSWSQRSRWQGRALAGVRGGQGPLKVMWEDP